MINNLPHRKDIRLNKYDYSSEGYYFLTICTKNKKCILSSIDDNIPLGILTLSPIGEIVYKYLFNIPNIYDNIVIDECIIMPNHIHMILVINNRSPISVPKAIQQFKGIVTKKLKYSIWQRSYYEHIIRNNAEYLMIKQYIIDNPINWKRDKYY